MECAFGILQERFVKIRGLARFFHLETFNDIMIACLSLYNMIVQDEQGDNRANDFEYEQFNES